MLNYQFLYRVRLSLLWGRYPGMLSKNLPADCLSPPRINLSRGPLSVHELCAKVFFGPEGEYYVGLCTPPFVSSPPTFRNHNI